MRSSSAASARSSTRADFGLVEELAAFIAELVMTEFGSPRVRVSVAKLGILKDVGRIGITIERARK